MWQRILVAAVCGALITTAAANHAPDTGRSPFPTYTRALQLEPGATTSADVSIGDVNGDGMLDIAAARSGAPNMIYFAGRSK